MNYIENVQNAIDFIEKDLSINYDLEEIAKEAAMSLPHLYRLFYSLTGHPLKDYIRKRRISLAAEHLRYSDLSILEIAVNVGFESHASLSKTFKKIIGMSPGLYRKSDIYYSFERINLFEKVFYLEDRDVTEKYPDIKLLRMRSMSVYTFLYKASVVEGIEKNALRVVQQILDEVDLEAKKVRYFGYNVALDSNHYGYMLLIPADAFKTIPNKMKLEDFPGGQYASLTTPAQDDSTIVKSWNRLLSEWLPRSTFAKGTQNYLEEFITYNNKLVRMKLYLPIEKEADSNLIEIKDIPLFTAAYCREYGEDAASLADKHLENWLETTKHTGNTRLYMSYYYGSDNDHDHWHEYGVIINSKHDMKNSNIEYKSIGGGKYACLKTKAYGTISGILDVMYRWIIYDRDYLLDENRQWFAEYEVPHFNSDEEEISVICYIPVLTRKGGAHGSTCKIS